MLRKRRDADFGSIRVGRHSGSTGASEVIEHRHCYSITTEDRNNAAKIIALRRTISKPIIKIGLMSFTILFMFSIFKYSNNISKIFENYNLQYFMTISLYTIIIVFLERSYYYFLSFKSLKLYFSSVPNRDSVDFAWNDEAFWEPSDPEKATLFSNCKFHLATTHYQFLRFESGHISWMPTRNFNADDLQDIKRVVQMNIPSSSFWTPL
jgi:hypothetical protein